MNFDTSKKIENKKWRNSSILFELLLHQITSDMLSGKDCTVGVSIMKKYFNENTEIGKEFKLYKALMDKTNLTEIKAVNYIDLVLEQRRKINETKLDKEKYDLIKEIKNNYNYDQFLSYKIPNYVLCASIYKTFMTEAYRSTNKDIINIADVATAKFTLIEHLCSHIKNQKPKTEVNTILEVFANQSKEVRDKTYAILIDKFNKKYADFNDNQKSLLREYVNSLSNKVSLKEYIDQIVPLLKQKIELNKENVKDKVLEIKLNEVASQIDKIAQRPKIKDSDVTALLIAFEIAKEIED